MEEALLEKTQLFESRATKRTAQGLQKENYDLCIAGMAGVEKVPDVLPAFLREWWIEHILKEDMQYKQFFQEGGIG